MSSPILVTGAAGFIGMLVSDRLLRDGHRVVGIDNLNDYYAPALKQARLRALAAHAGFRFEQVDIADTAALAAVFDAHRPQQVVHLAAQAGVRYALDHPHAYVASNLAGVTGVLENCRRHRVAHLVMASSSSVYGGRRDVPFRERDAVDHPVSFYAATKRANEVMAHSYAHLFGLPISVLRYFTVYGPWGRPDMAIWKFTEALLAGRPIEVYGGGVLSRDFTFGEDCAQATVRVLALPPRRSGSADPRDWQASGPDTSWAPFEIYNVGRSDPVSVNQLIDLLEGATGRAAIRIEQGMQPGDVERTCADPAKLRAATGYEPVMPLAEGLARFVAWYRAYAGGADGLRSSTQAIT
jgi:UDP-glucuronate 4-epimerase